MKILILRNFQEEKEANDKNIFQANDGIRNSYLNENKKK